MSDPVVSVAMAARDAAATVGEAIASILGQEGVAFELIVVDDGSTDGTGAALAALGDPCLTVLRNGQPLGLTASLERAVAAARAPLVARMDADDVSLPGRLARQVAAMDGGAAVCFTRAVLVDGGNNVTGDWREPPWALARWRGLFDNGYGLHPTAMFRREAILAAGGYDPAFRYAQDYDLWDRCVARGLAFAYVPEALLRFRDHAGSVTRRHGAEQAAAAARVSDRALARAFPDADAGERAGLRWLMRGGEMPDVAAVAAALARCRSRVGTFVRSIPGSSPGTGRDRRAVWRDVAMRLRRRRADLPPSLVPLARGPMMAAGLRAPSPVTIARALWE